MPIIAARDHADILKRFVSKCGFFALSSKDKLIKETAINMKTNFAENLENFRMLASIVESFSFSVLRSELILSCKSSKISEGVLSVYSSRSFSVFCSNKA